MHLNDLREKSIEELTQTATEMKVDNPGGLKKHEIIFAILKTHAKNDEEIFGSGVLEILPDGFGFLRSPTYNYLPGADDIYVSPSQIRRSGLRKGDSIEGQIRPPKEGERYFALLKVKEVNAQSTDKHKKTVLFDNLNSFIQIKRLNLSTNQIITPRESLICSFLKGLGSVV